MIFADIQAGSSVFVDANTFVYHFVPHPIFQSACRDLLERIARQEILGFTSTHVLSDVAHRVMTMEAMMCFGWPAKGIAQRLRQHPVEIQQLTDFRRAVDEIPNLGLHVLSIQSTMVSVAARISQQIGLLSGDALIVAIMQGQGLINLASHDADFDRVKGLARYGPG